MRGESVQEEDETRFAVPFSRVDFKVLEWLAACEVRCGDSWRDTRLKRHGGEQSRLFALWKAHRHEVDAPPSDATRQDGRLPVGELGDGFPTICRGHFSVWRAFE